MEVDDVTGIGPFSTYPRTSVVEGNQVVRLIGSPYRFRDYRANLEVVFQNKVQTSEYRAVGHPIACAVTETLVDHAARKLALDPFQIRCRNIITQDLYPYTSPTGYKFERLSHEACLDKMQALMDYPACEKSRQGCGKRASIAESESRVRRDYQSLARLLRRRWRAFSAQDGAIIKITPSGDVRCLILGEHGQGTETIIAQIVADQLGIDYEAVRVITGDTDVTPHGGATGRPEARESAERPRFRLACKAKPS